MVPLIPIISSFFAFSFRAVVYKAVFFGVVLAAVSVLLPWILDLMAGCGCSAANITTGLLNLFSKFPAGAWFFIDLFSIGNGLRLIFCALVVRFIIRRMPLVG